MGEITLKEYFEKEIEGVKASVKTAYDSMEKRLEGMNEFRNQLKDQTATFLTKSESTVRLDRIDSDIRELRESKAQLAGKASQGELNSTRVLAIISLAVGIISLIIKFF